MIAEALLVKRRASQVPPATSWPVLVDVSGHGIGDAAVMCWLADGSEGKLRLLSRGDNKAILTLFCQPDIEWQESARTIGRGFARDIFLHGYRRRVDVWLECFGLDTLPSRPNHSLTEGQLQAARKAYGGERRVALCPRTSWENKAWPAAHWRQLRLGLLDRGFNLAIVGNDDRFSDLPEHKTTTIREAAALLCVADLVVTNDSGPAHIAATLGTETLALMGPATESTFGHAENVRCLSVSKAELDCIGCWWSGPYDSRVCDTGCLGLSLLSPQRVLDAVDKPRATPELACDYCSTPTDDLAIKRLVAKTNTGKITSLGLPDRHITLDMTLKRLKHVPHPIIVETGTVRAREDWSAGYFTYIITQYLRRRRSGRLWSVDISESAVGLSRTLCDSPRARIVQGDSVGFLESFREPIDLLYVDSLDTDHPGHAEHALREVMAAERMLRGLVLVDDSPHRHGRIVGKGQLAIPYLQKRGWNVVHHGYQVLLEKGV